jgi:hypothetical protein
MKIKTHILYSITVFRKSCSLEIMWKNMLRLRQATDDNIIRRVRFACWITKATDTHSVYVMFIYLLGNNGHLNAYKYHVYK